MAAHIAECPFRYGYGAGGVCAARALQMQQSRATMVRSSQDARGGGRALTFHPRKAAPGGTGCKLRAPTLGVSSPVLPPGMRS